MTGPTIPSREQRPAPAVGAYDIIMRAASDGACDPAKLRELLAARREWRADEAAAAFNRAVVTFQARAKIVQRSDVANGRAYAKMDRIWREIRSLMDECGLAVTWESVATSGESCVLDGHLRHADGHAQPLHHEMPVPERVPGQNASQRAGAAETYCKRYATIAALGLQTGTDTDACVAVPATPSAIADARSALAARGSDEASACAYLDIRTLDEATADQITHLLSAMAARGKSSRQPVATNDHLEELM